MEVSVIVPVFNGGRTLRQCIESILAVRFPRGEFELICVDNASTDNTPAILRDFGTNPETNVETSVGTRVRVLHETRRGAAAARNAGLRAASGKFVAFTDADCAVDPGWLEHLLDPLRRGRADAVGGRILSRAGAGWIERFGNRIHDHAAAIEQAWPPYLITMNLAMPLDLLRKHRGFDERWLRSQDAELSFRLTDAGCRFAYAPRAIIRHHHRSTVAALCREGYIHGYYGAELYRIYAELDARPPTSPRRDPEQLPQRGWRDAVLHRMFRAAKRLGWAIGKRRPPRSLRSPIPVLMDVPIDPAMDMDKAQ